MQEKLTIPLEPSAKADGKEDSPNTILRIKRFTGFFCLNCDFGDLCDFMIQSSERVAEAWEKL